MANYEHNEGPHLVQLLPGPKEAVADPLTKTSAVWLVVFFCAMLPNS